MSIVGIASTKDYLYLVMTTAKKADFAVTKCHRILVDSDNWSSLVTSLSTHLGHYQAEDTIETFVIARCSSGKFPASPEAFKAEGFAELKCQELGHPISRLARRSFKKHLNCKPDQKWQAAAKGMFNSDMKITYFSSGYDAAISGAYCVAK